MPNEQIFEQWTEETAAEYFDRVGDYDGTERKDGGDRNEVPDLDEFNDTADKDRYENEAAQYDAALESFDTELAECSSEAEELATVSRLTKHFLGLGYFAYIVNEAALFALADATIYRHQQQNTPN